MNTAICSVCSTQFIQRGGNHHITCSRECGRKRHIQKVNARNQRTEVKAAHQKRSIELRRARRRSEDQTCMGCLKIFRDSRKRKYCSKACIPKHIHTPKLRSLKCAVCTNPFTTSHAIKNTCSSGCAKEYQSRKHHLEYVPTLKIAKNCAACGIQFIAASKDHKTCSKVCKARHNRNRCNIWVAAKMKDPTYRAQANLKSRLKKRKRDAIKDNAPLGSEKPMAEWEKSWRSLRRVKCFWCLSEFKSRDCHADHIIPLSKGGIHAVENLCIACPACNLKKGATNFSTWNSRIAQPALI